MINSCHSLRGVWVEMTKGDSWEPRRTGHSLRGVWVEISHNEEPSGIRKVTPFGECGLKCCQRRKYLTSSSVTPFGECGLKFPRLPLSDPEFESLPSGSVG